jgi:hypothetical protein
MRSLQMACLVLVACHGSEQGVKTQFVTRQLVLAHQLERSCERVGLTHERKDTSQLPTFATSGKTRCLPKAEYGGDVALHISWTANSGLTTADGSEVCRLQLGPDRLNKPLRLDFVSALVRDFKTREVVEHALSDLPTDHAYGVTLLVDGVRIRVDQYRDLDGTSFEASFDGCARLPAGTDRVTDYEGSEHFVGEPLSFQD